MKDLKKIAILFLVLTFFYNVLGLYIFFADQKEQTWVKTMEKVDESKFEIFEFNISPYGFIVDSGFEEENKDIIINNTVYHVFKNRIQNNVLKLYCLKISQGVVSRDFRNLVNNHILDNTSSKEDPIKKLLKSFCKDYIPTDESSYEFSSLPIFEASSISIITKNDLLFGFYKTHYPPPNVS